MEEEEEGTIVCIYSVVFDDAEAICVMLVKQNNIMLLRHRTDRVFER